MRVMVGIDDSQDSFYALQWVLDNLLTLRGLRPATVPAETEVEEEDGSLTLVLVHVHEPFQPYGLTGASPGIAAYYPPTPVFDSVRKYQEQTSAALLSRAAQMCKNKMVRAESVIVEGNPKEKICEISEGMNIDLLVVGSRGLGKLKRAFLGSVSDYCGQHAKCATLIVKPPPNPNPNPNPN